MKTTEIIWELCKASPALWQKLTVQVPDIVDQYRAIAEELPVPENLEPFDNSGSARPLRHLRSFYVKLKGGGVIAIKGSEIDSDHVEEKLHFLKQIKVDYPSKGRSLFSVTEHFPITEQKVPMAVSLGECREDMESAILVQERHVSSFKTFAHTPIPLAILKWTDSISENFLRKLLPMLSPRASQIVEMVATQGLGVIIYYYPELPIRVAHMELQYNLPQGNYYNRLTRINTLFDVEHIIDSWIDNVTRLLVMKVIPGSIESIGIGHCLEVQNAVLDGGFVDMGSIKPFSEIRGEQEFTQTLSTTVIDLSNTIRAFLLGPEKESTAEYRNPTITMMNTVTAVREKLRERLKSYEKDHTLDDRLNSWLLEGSVFEKLNAVYAALYPSLSLSSSHNKPGSTGTEMK